MIKNIDLMIRDLIQFNGYDLLVPKDLIEKEAMLKTLMTVSKAGELSESYYEAEKIYLKEKYSHINIIDVKNIYQ